MCVPIGHPFPSINPARTGTGPCGGAPHTALSPHSGPSSSRNGEAGQALNRKSMSASVGIVASFSRAVLASPECAWHHRNTAFTRLTDVGPRLRVHPSLDHVVGRRQRAGLGRAGARWVNSVPADTLSPCRRTSPSSTRRGQCASTAGTPTRSCRCAWPDRRGRGNSQPSWAPSPKGYLTAPEKVICLRGR